MAHAHRRLGLPTGTETVQLRDAARHHRISAALERVFSLWGYTPAETPLIDYYEVYRRLIPDSADRRNYRAVDRQGETLVVRSDTTLFLAKQLGLHLRVEELPVRVYYNDQIVRVEDEYNLSNNEFQQAGIELVGIAGAEGEAEAIVIAWQSLAALDVKDAVMHLGSHRIARAVAEQLGYLDSDDVEGFLNRVRVRKAGHEAPFLGFIGTVNEFLAAVQDQAPSVRESARPFLALLEALNDTLLPEQMANVRVDLSELGIQSYYTDAAFGFYLPDVNAAVLRGGRYDALLASFGFEAPSVGFSIYTRKLPAGTKNTENDSVQAARGDTFAERVANARAGHADGRRVSL